MKIVIAAALCALGLAACAPSSKEGAVSESVAAPQPAGVTHRLEAKDKGGAFTLAVGQRVSVSLVGVPTAGYVWDAAAPPAFLKKIAEQSGPTTKAQSQPGFAGGNHWEVLVFEAVAPGKGELRLEQKRPWETNEPANDTWSATIEVK